MTDARYREAAILLSRYLGPRTIPYGELSRGFISNRAVLIPQAINCIMDLLKERTVVDKKEMEIKSPAQWKKEGFTEEEIRAYSVLGLVGEDVAETKVSKIKSEGELQASINRELINLSDIWVEIERLREVEFKYNDLRD